MNAPMARHEQATELPETRPAGSVSAVSTERPLIVWRNNEMRTDCWIMWMLALAVGMTSGCGTTRSTPNLAENPADQNQRAASAQTGGHDHSGWWCDEHGVPEEICALCDSKVAAEFQRKEDWCPQHDRPSSQCFVCHPELEAKFAARYEAKYGKKPPKPVWNY